ncbi:MAG: hypothetical protein AAF447_23830, partial [Myxococcota bacterium]
KNNPGASDGGPDGDTSGRAPPPDVVVPNVGQVLTRLKRSVLKGAVVVLSGIVPLAMDVHLSETGRLLKSFGASIRTSIDARVTHLVVSNFRPRTQKAAFARRRRCPAAASF